MSSPLFATYMLAIFVVIAIPGPLSLFMVNTSAQHGLLRAWPAFVGGVSASLCLLILSAVGVGALILASPSLFSWLQVVGAAYLMYLGVKAWRSAGMLNQPSQVADKGKRFGALFSHAFLLGISNPKDIAFFVALLPQFVSAQAPLSTQLGWMIVGWVVVDLFCKTSYGLLAQLFFQRVSMLRRLFLKISALLFIILGLLVWFEHVKTWLP